MRPRRRALRLVPAAQDAGRPPRQTRALRDLAASARSRDLFGRARGLSAAQRARYNTLRARRAELRKAAALLREGTVPFFAFEIHAPETMAEGGFSTVLGNPPWVRAERMPPAAARARAGRAPRGPARGPHSRRSATPCR